jgi:hypothetical protein
LGNRIGIEEQVLLADGIVLKGHSLLGDRIDFGRRMLLVIIGSIEGQVLLRNKTSLAWQLLCGNSFVL